MIHLRNNERDHEHEVTMKISLIPLEMGRNITWRIIHRDREEFGFLHSDRVSEAIKYLLMSCFN